MTPLSARPVKSSLVALQGRSLVLSAWRPKVMREEHQLPAALPLSREASASLGCSVPG